MKIENLKDLKKLIKLCRETGVTDVKVDGLEFHLGPEPYIAPERESSPEFLDPLANIQVPMPNIAKPKKRKDNPLPEAQSITQDDIKTPDELTQEQLLMWSVGGDAQ